MVLNTEEDFFEMTEEVVDLGFLLMQENDVDMYLEKVNDLEN